MRKILILIFLVLLTQTLTRTALAETGTVIVTNDTYRKDDVAPFEVTTRSPDWGMILIDYPNFNKVSNISIFMNGQMTFNKESNYTNFVIAQNGSGHGVLSYSKALDRVNYVFSDDSVFTGMSVNLTFDYPIMNDTRITTANKTSGSRPPGDGYQLCINVVRSANGLLSCLTGNVFGISYQYVKTETSRVSYTTTYETNLAGQFFTINVNKSQSLINNKVKLHSQTQTYQNETTFNMNNLYFAGNYLDGLWLNLSVTSGAYQDQLINATGAVGISTPVPTITPTINPAYGTGIAWGKTNYSLGEIGYLSWIIDGSVFDFISDFNIKITDQNGATLKEFHNLGATGNAQYQFPVVGVYTASFYKSICVFGLCTNDFKGDSSTSVSLSTSYIFITSPVISGVGFNASYIFGNTVINQGELNSVIIEQFTDGGLSSYSTTSLNNFNIVAGTSYNVSLIVGSPGKYKATLFDVSRGRIADVNFDAVVGFIPPQANITSSYVTTDKLAYFFSESIIASYAIDNVNYTNGSLSKYFAIKNNDKNLYVFITPNGIGWPLTEQVDTFEVPINSGSEDVPCQTNKNCFKFNSNTIFYPGSTSIELHAKTNNTDTILAFGNFTINQIDSDGYGLFLSKSNTCVNDPVVITVSSPINSTVQIIEHSNVADNIVFSEWNSSGNNKTTTRRFFHTGTYEVNLIDQSANTRFNRYINVNSKYCTVTPTPTTPPVTASGTTSQITNFLTSNLFWALVMIVGFMLAIAYKERKGN